MCQCHNFSNTKLCTICSIGSRCNHAASSSRNLTLPVQTTNFCAVLVLLLTNVPTKPTQLAVDCEWNILYHNQVCLYDTDQNPRRNRGPTWCWSYHPVTFTMGSHIRYKARTNLFLIGNRSNLQCLQSSLAQDGGANHWQLCITDLQTTLKNG